MRIKAWHAVALISIVILAAYYPALSAPLNSVDDVMMVNDLMNRSGFTWQDFLFPSSKSYYRPLINSSFILDRFLWNLEAPFLHLENLLLHLFNTLMVFMIARRGSAFLNLKENHAPLAAALLFGVHPINTEAVIWVAGRADLMAGCFVLLTVFCTFNYLQSRNSLWATGAALMFFLGCLAKETTLLIWPGVLLAGFLASRVPGRWDARPDFPLRRALIPAFYCSFSIAGYFFIRSIALRDTDLGVRHVSAVLGTNAGSSKAVVKSSFDPALLLEKLEKATTVSGFYLRKILQPFPLNFGITEVPETYFWLGLVLVFTCLFLLLRPSWAGWFFLSAVSLGSIALLVAFGGISWTPVAERYMYVPSAMASVGFVLAGARALQGKAAAWHFVSFGLLCGVLLVSASGVFQRALVWQDNVTLFEDTVKKSPGFKMGHNELAMALMQRGDRERAMEIMRNLDIPEFQVASLNKVSVWVADGEYEKAHDYLIERLKNPHAYRRVILERLVMVLRNMAAAAHEKADVIALQGEMLHYLRELWKTTHDPFYLYRLGRLHMNMGDYDQAQLAFAEAYRLFPETSIYKQPSGRLAEAMKSP